MHFVEAKLAEWKKLYLELREAEALLNQANAAGAEDNKLKALRAEVVRLQRESEAALEAVQAQLARMKRGTEKA